MSTFKCRLFSSYMLTQEPTISYCHPLLLPLIETYKKSIVLKDLTECEKCSISCNSFYYEIDIIESSKTDLIYDISIDFKSKFESHNQIPVLTFDSLLIIVLSYLVYF